MINKQRIRILAEAERLMDQGKVPWVWSPSQNGTYERMAVTPEIMTELGLEQGQTINQIILEAIAEISMVILRRKLDEILQKVEDDMMDPNFDFRSMMNDDDS